MGLASQTIFKRYELKYLISAHQKQVILQAMGPYMTPDEYGKTTIRNIYFDTDHYRLIRRSIERPAYKEKLRIRSYDLAKPGSTVYVELKKKYDHVVYKRRVSLPEKEAMIWLCSDAHCPVDTQISREIDYFLSYYETLKPRVFLSYEREAYYSKCGDGFRVTFDENILCRMKEFSLQSDIWGKPLLKEGLVLMEIKSPDRIPMWMTKLLSRERIYRSSFSKYGTAYEQIIFPKLKEATQYA